MMGGSIMNKVYVDVTAEFGREGGLVPISFIWEDGRKYDIDRVLKKERCASRKAGGTGDHVHLHGTGAGEPLVF